MQKRLLLSEWLGHLNEAVLLVGCVEYWGLEGLFRERIMVGRMIFDLQLYSTIS